MKEYLDIFDENNKSLNEKKERKIVHEKGLWHREVSVWIINDKNELLIQKRAATKKLAPNKWALCAGHIISGESIIEAAIREVEEEVGIENLCPADLILFDIHKSSNITENIQNNNYKYCYILKTNYKESDLKIQEEELSEAKFVSFEDLKKWSKDEPDIFTGSLKGEKLENTITKIKEKLKELEEEY